MDSRRGEKTSFQDRYGDASITLVDELDISSGQIKVVPPSFPLACSVFIPAGEHNTGGAANGQTSIGNAKIAGMSADLKMSSRQYSLVIIAYYCELSSFPVAYLYAVTGC